MRRQFLDFDLGVASTLLNEDKWKYWAEVKENLSNVLVENVDSVMLNRLLAKCSLRESKKRAWRT